MASLSYYWSRSATETVWTIAYRYSQSNILEDKNTPFLLKCEENGFWGADPFLFEYNGDIYLFYELFVEKQSKGVIAVSKYENGRFTSPKIVIDEKYHMSFPCIFTMKGKIYMIPETGSINALLLYECEEFPLKWVKRKVLLEDVTPSDTIVYSDNRGVWVIASMLKNSTCYAQNRIYKLDESKLELLFCCNQLKEGECGYRNAGFIFQHDGQLIRPGQNCENRQYGKSLYFWGIDNFNNSSYSEKFLKEIKSGEISIRGRNDFNGIHTYNRLGRVEVVDLKKTRKNSMIRRVRICFNLLFDYIKEKALKR